MLIVYVKDDVSRKRIVDGIYDGVLSPEFKRSSPNLPLQIQAEVTFSLT